MKHLPTALVSITAFLATTPYAESLAQAIPERYRPAAGLLGYVGAGYLSWRNRTRTRELTAVVSGVEKVANLPSEKITGEVIKTQIKQESVTMNVRDSLDEFVQRVT